MSSPRRHRIVSLALGFLAMLILVSGVLRAQGNPPWKTAGHPFYNNPVGYARDLHRRYVANQADLARTKAALPTYKREKTGAEMSGLGFFDALRDELELARRREAAQKQIESHERTRDELEREWDTWCRSGLLGSPMPELVAANESIADTYLDNSTYPPARKTRMTDRIDFNIRYFLEQKAAPPPAAAGGPGSGTFPKDPFNGLQITYGISGAALGKSEDGGPFEGWIRSYGGSLHGDTLRISGSVTKGPGASKEYPGNAAISVWAGDRKEERTIRLEEGKPAAYDVSVSVPAGATAGGVSVHVWGDYRNGEMRFVQVVAKLANPALEKAAAPAIPPRLPEPQPPVRPSELGWGYIYPGSLPLELAPAGRSETERAQIGSSQPLGWVAGDRLAAGAGSPAVFIFPEDIRGVLGAGSRLELRKNGAYLGTGSVLCDLLKHGWGFNLQTPTAAIRAEESLFAAQVLPDGTTLVAVGIGTASVADAGGNNPVAIQAGYWARIAAGRQTHEPAPLTAQVARSLFGEADLLTPPEAAPEVPAEAAAREPGRPADPQPGDTRPAGIPSPAGTGLAGTWESEVGPVTLLERGAAVEGFWTDKAGARGQVRNGQIMGTGLNFEYVWPDGRRGTASFAWNSQSSRWEGNWRHVDGMMGFWNLGPAKTGR